VWQREPEDVSAVLVGEAVVEDVLLAVVTVSDLIKLN
jgi:hypothetical protein